MAPLLLWDSSRPLRAATTISEWVWPPVLRGPDDVPPSADLVAPESPDDSVVS